jgi:hypothetical protein
MLDPGLSCQQIFFSDKDKTAEEKLIDVQLAFQWCYELFPNKIMPSEKSIITLSEKSLNTALP